MEFKKYVKESFLWLFQMLRILPFFLSDGLHVTSSNSIFYGWCRCLRTFSGSVKLSADWRWESSLHDFCTMNFNAQDFKKLMHTNKIWPQAASTHQPSYKRCMEDPKTFPYNAIDSVQNCHKTKKCKDFFYLTRNKVYQSQISWQEQHLVN